MSAHEYDVVIRGGVIVDGSGAEPFVGDVAIKQGRIAVIGSIADLGAEEVDARGQLVTPGFVDIHTHYDGQVTWDERLQPSSWHGVTTVLMGNCGVGFAPCRAEDRERLILLMEGVEDIPEPVLAAGLPWNWESFPDYLDALSMRRFDVDVGTQLPHAALRVYVMGERGADCEPATAQDIAKMRALANEAMAAGAFGFSTSRAYTHKTRAGESIPTCDAGEDELVGIALGLRDAGRGVLQYVGDSTLPLVEEMARASGRPLAISVAQTQAKPNAWRAALNQLEVAQTKGVTMRAQVCGRAVGFIFGLELTMNPFTLHPSYAPLADLALSDKVRALSGEALRERLLAEASGPGHVFNRESLIDFDNMYPLNGVPDYEPSGDATVAAIARRRGISPQQLALELMLRDDGRGKLYSPFANYANRNLDAAREMLTHPLTLSGLSDGGAHVGMICDGSLPTFMLTHWTRDRTRGPKLDLAEVVKMQTADTADWMGLADRGRLKTGLRADINVIDYDRLALHAPEVTHDMPAAGRRLLQRASGYTVTMVNGVITYRDGEPTGALPGRLVRSTSAA